MPKPVSNSLSSKHTIVEPTPDDFLHARIGFHGAKSEQDAVTMASVGFKSYVVDEDGFWKREGNLGVGNYFSCDWKMALWFGRVLLQISLTPGTRILDVRPAADIRTIKYLKREFGHELFDGKPLYKVLPERKNLTQAQLIELVRYFYHKTWSGKWSESGANAWPRKRIKAAQSLHSAVSLLKRAGFQGYGDPESDNGIVVWASDRIKIVKVVKSLDPQSHINLIDKSRLKEMTLEGLVKLGQRRRSQSGQHKFLPQ